MKNVSIVIPVFNEESGIVLLLERLYQLISKEELKHYNFEFLFVNDGSKDATWELLQHAQKAETSKKHISLINLSRNFGKEVAMMAGIDRAKGDCAVVIDADLQDPPELIPLMLQHWENGFQDVYARRVSRDGESFMKKWTSKSYYRFLQSTTNIPIQIDTGDFRLLDRKCLDALKQLPENSRNTKALFSWIGFKKKEITYRRDARQSGASKFNYFKLIELALDGITSFTTTPLRLATILGAGISAISFIYAIFTLFKNMFHPDGAHGYASTLIIILFLGGVQLLSIGILGEYISRIFIETKRRPLYYVEEYIENK